MEYAEQGARLRQLREAKGLARHGLGVAVGRTSQTVLNWEQGKNRPSIDTVVRMGDVLDAKAELLELYGYTTEQSMAATVRDHERRIDALESTVERLAGLLSLVADVTVDQAAKPRRRPKP